MSVPLAPTRSSDDRYLVRQLSMLEFNARVLALVEDESTPLLERLRFVAICSSNLDEFYQVRVGELLDSLRDGQIAASRVLEAIDTRIAALIRRGSEGLGEVLGLLAAQGVSIVPVTSLADSERAELAAQFHSTILPVLTPLAVGPGRPFPYISSLSLSLAVTVRDPATASERLARVKVPEMLPRFLRIGESDRFIALEDLIATHLGALFDGMQVVEHATFRVTRDADIDVEEAEEDVLSAVERQLSRRRFGELVRVELAAGMSEAMRTRLLGHLEIAGAHIYEIEGLLDLADLAEIASLDRPDLRFAEWTGITQNRLRSAGDEPVDMFAAIRDGDILVSHPYDSFATSVERFIEQAVDDPDVLAIKHTIYRTSGDSPIVPGLIRASEQGKQAVVLVELKARFDEERNIRWARALERSGVHVVYGFTALKTHAKCALVVRREGRGIRRYVHIGTGNYHPRTARLYTDVGLFTCRPDIAGDVADLFNYLTGFSRPGHYRKLLVAPTDLREGILGEVRRVIDEGGRIVMKMNGLSDRGVIDALYEASQAGVQIDLVVRGICCLRPGIEGLSERVRVRSVLGRFLEHERVYRFEGADATRTFIGSADMMPRNINGRVEVLVPVEDPTLADELAEHLHEALSDTSGSWELSGDGVWSRCEPLPGDAARSSQQRMMERALAILSEAPNELAERIARQSARRAAE